MSLLETRNQLLDIIQRRASSPALEWLTAALVRLAESEQPEEELLTLSAMARRRMGTDPLGPAAAAIDVDGEPFDAAHWSLGDAARTLLLMEALLQNPAPGGRWVESLFRHGDETERVAVMQALELFPDAPGLKPIALEVGRCNSLVLYAAMALRNPYIARHYDEHEFNQVVLKSLFTGLPIEHIQGLRQRANRDLARMCEDYAEERLAAGREPPADIWLAIAPHASERGRQLLLRFLGHPDPAQRHYAALAIGSMDPAEPELTAALREQLEREEHPRVKASLETLLGA
ncbi:MAG TPA: HEAT repeat domain-containing protein [Sedimenticola sp.]|nr:HEAT repeat domain-containing protein [Sedimenticola sp.]